MAAACCLGALLTNQIHHDSQQNWKTERDEGVKINNIHSHAKKNLFSYSLMLKVVQLENKTHQDIIRGHPFQPVKKIGQLFYASEVRGQ